MGWLTSPATAGLYAILSRMASSSWPTLSYSIGQDFVVAHEVVVLDEILSRLAVDVFVF
jgi:hypothetical protein